MHPQSTLAPNDRFIPLHADSLHDLAGPVNQISVMLDLYLNRKQPGSGDDAILKLILDSRDRLRKLILALQDYDRVAGAPPRFQPCEGNNLLAIAVRWLDAAIVESGAKVQQNDLPRIQCDPNQMTYAFASLIENAIKFRSEEPPEVRISAASQGDDWLFSVRDNGIGIEPRHQQSAFHMFRRIHGDRYPGVGAGLAITRRIVESHGGRIWVESLPGRGSAFFFTLPSDPWKQTCGVGSLS
jgi:light-regulated signal transduction histidine kinase (bacteriophytochrome)